MAIFYLKRMLRRNEFAYEIILDRIVNVLKNFNAIDDDQLEVKLRVILCLGKLLII